MDKNYKVKPHFNDRSWDFYKLYSGNKSTYKVFTVRTHYIENGSWIPKHNKEKWASNKLNASNKKSRFQNIWKVVESYLENSTLHGLKYVGDTSISYGERFFWLTSFVCALACAMYFIINIYAKYTINPVIITMNPTPTPVRDIPFPSVTVCNMNLIGKSESKIILTNGTTSDRSFLNNICESDNPHYSANTLDNHIEDQGRLGFISTISQPCGKMLSVCKWMLGDIDCNQLFIPFLTDLGLCCTFNQLPLEYILRNPESMTKFYSTFDSNYENFEIDDWNPERGYSLGAAYDVFPFRSRGPGAHLGLSLVMDTNVDDYYCSSGSSAGIKVLLHNPAEIPIMKFSSFMIPPGVEIRAVFKPVINDATNNFKSIDVSKRQCYFAQERYLKYFRTYTKTNCWMECLANITEEKCGCVSYYLPSINKNIGEPEKIIGNIQCTRDIICENYFIAGSDSTKICGKVQEACSESIRNMMEIEQTPSKEEKLCNCLPECFQLKYDKSMSYGQLTDAFDINKEVIKNQTYFVKNMVAIQLYFVSTQFNKFTKSELYGFSEFVSNTGGILGLFLGFGTLSIVEICYHFTLKWICSAFRSKRRTIQQRQVSLAKQMHLRKTVFIQETTAVTDDVY